MINFSSVPDGYVTGLPRDGNADQKVAHLYKGDFSNPGKPMCAKGWNRDDGTAYSIFRNNVGDKGICKVCMRRALKGLDGVSGKKVLYLHLKEEWYRKIESGEKTIEYREVKPYWIKRFKKNKYDLVEFERGYGTYDLLLFKILKIKKVKTPEAVSGIIKTPEAFAIELGARL